MMDQVMRQGRSTYRPDIDGLRAIAVLSVFGYHLGVMKLKGGFVGVDVFFVISGYLISQILLERIESDRPSFIGFYASRIRRIIPALAVMIVTSFALAYFITFPQEYLDFGRSALAAGLSYSNIFFYLTKNYFDHEANTMPLLHTWSLGVEEQFYLVFPWVFLGLKRILPNRMTLGICVIALASFAYSVVEVALNQPAAFYLPISRAWEFLIGTLLVCMPWAIPHSRAAREVSASCGLLLIGLSVVLLGDDVPFPGIAALPACLGAAMIIAAGRSGNSLVSRMLSLRPITFIGLISYSLYLWHWPIIVFHHLYPIVLPDSHRAVTRLAIVLVALAVATLSWKFIEQPTRHMIALRTSRNAFSFGAVSCAAVCSLAFVVFWQQGLPQRYSAEALKYAAYFKSDVGFFRSGTCFVEPPYSIANFDRQTCLERVSGKPNYLLIGDSHAAQLWYGLSTVWPDINIQQLTAAGCAPLISQRAIASRDCHKLMEFAFNDYLKRTPVDRLLFVARWEPGDLPRIKEVLQWASLRNIPVTLFGPAAEYDQSVPRLLAYAADVNDARLPERHRVDLSELDDSLRQLAANNNVTYISIQQRMCSAEACTLQSPNGHPFMFDTNHFTQDGSVAFAQTLVASDFGAERERRAETSTAATQTARQN